MKTIIIAYACDPNKGSEEGVGYNYVLAISRFSECLVITSIENKDILENININNVKWLFVEEDIIKKIFKKKWSKISSSIFRFIIAYSYSRWQKNVEKIINKIIRSSDYDLVHKITYVGYRFPIFINNIPVINGPLGGIENMPKKYFIFMSFKGKILFFIRNILNNLQRNFSFSLKKIYSKENVNIISAHTNIQYLIKKYFNQDSLVLSEICFTKNHKFLFKSNSLIKIIWVGDIEPGKNLLSLLKAKKYLQNQNVRFELIICGSGSELNNLKKFVSINQLSNIEFKGKITRENTLKYLELSDIYISTSLKDLTSTSLVEAMSCGCAIITTPLQGFKDAIGSAKSLFLSLESEKDLISSLINSILFLINNEKLRNDYAKTTLIESKKFNINNVSIILEKYYKKILILK